MVYNFSVFSILATWGISLSAHAYAALAVDFSGKTKYSNANPRNQWSDLERKLPKELFERVQRSQAASLNIMETLPVWGLAVLAGNLAKLPVETLNTCTALWMASKLLYVIAYVNISSEKLSPLRSLIWMFGAGVSGYLVWVSGSALNA